MPGAVGLEEHAGPRHAFPAAAVAGRTTCARRRDPFLHQDAPERARRDRQVGRVLGELLGHVHGVEALVLRRRELDEPGPVRFVEAVGGWPAPVAVDEGTGALGAQPAEEATHLAPREPQVGGSLVDGQLPGQDMGEHREAPLRSGVEHDRLPRFHGFEVDKVAVPLGRVS